MRNISFALTTTQVRHSFKTGEILKDVTRRLGWSRAKAGEQLCACEKCQGLGKGGKIVKLGVIELAAVGLERLDMMLTDPAYGAVEVCREGFPDKTPAQFVEMFCEHNGCEPTSVITRLEFRYLIKPVARVPLTATEARACCVCQNYTPATETRGRCAIHPNSQPGAYCTCEEWARRNELNVVR